MIFLNLECSSLNSPVSPIERFTTHYLYLFSSLFFGVIIYKVIFIFVSSAMIFLNLECASLKTPLTRIESTKIYRLHITCIYLFPFRWSYNLQRFSAHYLYLFPSLFFGVMICKVLLEQEMRYHLLWHRRNSSCNYYVQNQFANLKRIAIRFITQFLRPCSEMLRRGGVGEGLSEPGGYLLHKTWDLSTVCNIWFVKTPNLPWWDIYFPAYKDQASYQVEPHINVLKLPVIR